MLAIWTIGGGYVNGFGAIMRLCGYLPIFLGVQIQIQQIHDALLTESLQHKSAVVIDALFRMDGVRQQHGHILPGF